MEKKIKLAQWLKSSACSPNAKFSLNITIDAVIFAALKDQYRGDDDDSSSSSGGGGGRKPSSFEKTIITSLLTLCDDLYLDVFTMDLGLYGDRPKRWYNVVGSDPNTINYSILKHFLLDIYYDKSSNESRLNDDSFKYYSCSYLTFKDGSGKQKYNVTLRQPYPMTRAAKEVIVRGMCEEAFESILPMENDICTKFAVGSIFYKNLLTILNRED